MRGVITTLVLLAFFGPGAVLLTQCDSDDTVDSVSEFNRLDHDDQADLMGDVWRSFTPAEQAQACEAWTTDHDLAQDYVSRSASGIGLDPDLYFDMLDQHC